MSNAPAHITIRTADELDIDAIVAIDERITGKYRPDEWEQRLAYYLRRDPDASVVADAGGDVLGFMLGEVRSGEFGIDEPTGWVEVLGVDPDFRGQDIGRKMADVMFAHFRSLGATSVRTLVDDDEPGIGSFFSALGFQPAKLRPFALRL